MLGDRGHQRRRRGVRVVATQQIDRAPAPDQVLQIGRRHTAAGGAPATDRLLEEQRHRLLDRRDRVSGGAVVALQGSAEEPVPELGRVRVSAQDLLRLARVAGIGQPGQHPVQGVPLQRCCVEVRLEHLGAFRGVEPGRLITRTTGHGASYRSRCEGLGAALGDHRVLAPLDGVPDQLGYAGREVEGVEYRHGAVASLSVSDGEEEVLGLGQGHQRRPWGIEEGRGQQVEGLTRPLWSVHASGPVERDPQLHTSRDARTAQAPTNIRCLHHRRPTRSGRMMARRRRSSRSPSTTATSWRDAKPYCAPGPHERHHHDNAHSPKPPTASSTKQMAP